MVMMLQHTLLAGTHFSKLHFARSFVEQVITTINCDDAILELALPPVFGAGYLFKLRNDHICTVLLLFLIAAHI